MIRGMTGFGDASLERDGVHTFIEVRSLNSKFFKATIRLPDAYQALEADLEAALRRKLSRGTVTLTMSVSDRSAQAAYDVNHAALERYIEQVRRAPSVARGDVSLDVSSLLTLPGVLTPAGSEEDRIASARETAVELAEQACDRLVEMRRREGEALRADLLAQYDLITSRLEGIQRLAPTVVLEYERRLKQRVETLMADAGVRAEPADLIREIAVYAEKTDVAEEITRLREHMAHFHDLLGGDDAEPVGRRLEFVSQEMLREANTIASKSPSAEMARVIVEVKGAIDRIKEQVHNVE